MAQRSLRSVPADEKPSTPKVKTVAEAAKNGTQRELLVAMRDRVAEAVTRADCPARELASLTKRLQDITRDISHLDAQKADEAGEVSGAVDDTFDPQAI